jgi:hypothetical protein
MLRIDRRRVLVGVVASLVLPTNAFAAGQPDDDPAPLNGEGLLVVFPDYPVQGDGWYPNTDDVGHAGALIISNTGLTKYFEFGRYVPDGQVKNRSVSNVTIGAKGKATPDSLKRVLGELSAVAGKNGRIRAAYFVNMDFAAMQASANLKPPKYDLTGYNCGHFAEQVITAGNSKVDKPWIVNPTPNNIVDEYIEEGNAEVLFNPANGAFSIGDSDEADAKG